MAGRALISKLPSFSSSLRRLRPILTAASPNTAAASTASRRFSTKSTTSSLNEPAPNWSNRPSPKETILLEGCDFEHWLVVTEPPAPNLSREEIIDGYIKTLAQVLGSEEEARMKIYSVSTRCYFAFGALVSEELSYKIKTLPNVRWVLPDSYLDVNNKDYGGEPFIQGQAVPYDPKYHEEWLHNYNTYRRQPRRNDQPRNFQRRNENINFQNREAPPMPNQGFQSPPQQGDRPPMNSSSNVQNAPQMPNNEFNGVQPNTPARTCPNQTPLPQSNYAPTGPSYQGNCQNYQVGNLGPAHQGNGQGYQGGRGVGPANMPGRDY